MNAITKTSAFKTGNSVAVRLPKDFGIKPGEKLELVQNGPTIQINRVSDPDFEKAKVKELIRRLNELGPVAGAETSREDGRIEFSDRPGFY